MVAVSPKFSLADIRKAMVRKTLKNEKSVPSLPKVPVPIKAP